MFSMCKYIQSNFTYMWALHKKLCLHSPARQMSVKSCQLSWPLIRLYFSSACFVPFWTVTTVSPTQICNILTFTTSLSHRFTLQLWSFENKKGFGGEGVFPLISDGWTVGRSDDSGFLTLYKLLKKIHRRSYFFKLSVLFCIHFVSWFCL